MPHSDKSVERTHSGTAGAPARVRHRLTPLFGLCLLLSGMAGYAQGDDPREQTALERELAGEMVSIPGGSFGMTVWCREYIMGHLDYVGPVFLV